MTETTDQPGSDIRAGDRVTLRDDMQKLGYVIDVLEHRADWLPAGHPRPGDSNMAWVSWKGETAPVVEQLADLIKLNR